MSRAPLNNLLSFSTPLGDQYPTQAGDGAYLDHEVPSGLLADIRSLGIKDVKTLAQVMRTKATGELQDDKTMLMERVIQARNQPRHHQTY